jgi:phage-related protein (TIGR01555 family)
MAKEAYMSLMNRVKNSFRAFKSDSWFDEVSGRGSVFDKTNRSQGFRIFRTPYERMKQYQSNGFLQNIIEQPAEDATREWITVTTNRDEDLKINRLIEKRMEELGIRKKISDFIKFSRMYEKGSMLYYGVNADKAQTPNVLTEPLSLNTINRIDFINVIEEPDRFYFFILNRYDPTKADYNKVQFYIMGNQVHESRISWICYNWYPLELMGVSIIETVQDAVGAQDSALWSASSMAQDLASNVFTSDLVGTASPDKLAEMLWALKNQKNTQSVIGLKPGELWDKVTYTLTGIKELFEFIKECLAAVSRMPVSILFGKAHGVITAQEYDALGYYNNVAKFQEIEIRPIIKKIGDMIIHEQLGEIWAALGGAVDGLDWNFTFESLYKLDPKGQSEKELSDATRDEKDITNGKLSPQEARALDPRMDELKDFTSPDERAAAMVYASKLPAIDPGSQGEQTKGGINIQVDPIHGGADPEVRAATEEKQGIVKPDVITNFGMRTVKDTLNKSESI